MDSQNPTTAPPASGKMRMSPEAVKWLDGAVLRPPGMPVKPLGEYSEAERTEIDAYGMREYARRACESAWRKYDGTGPAPLDASDKPIKKGAPVELLPPPAGEDEARIRYPQYFGAAPTRGATAPGRTIRPPDEPAPGAPGSAIIPAEYIRLCIAEIDLARLIVDTAAGRLRRITESGEWLTWRDGDGWRPFTYDALLAAVALCGRENLGSRNRKGEEYPTPGPGGRSSTAAGVIRELAGLPGVQSAAADWDRNPGLVGLPGARLLDVRTGEQHAMTRDNLIRRQLAAAPADADAFARSRFSSLIRHVVPDDDEREYLKRRLGAALIAAPGLDDLIWLSGPSGCGKGGLVAALRGAFGEYAAVLPVSELIAGGNRGHLQWLAKLNGARILIADDVPPRALDVGVINRLLGSVLSAHHMRRESFDFMLTAPIFATSNYPPQVDAADGGFRRRLKPIAAGPSIPEPDQDPEVRPSMATAAECAAVVRWLCDGARAFTADGCPVPESIRARTADVAATTPLAEFVETFPPGEWIESGDLWRQWQAFKTGRGEQPGGRRTLTARLQADHGWCPERSATLARRRGWRVPGIGRMDALDALDASHVLTSPVARTRARSENSITDNMSQVSNASNASKGAPLPDDDEFPPGGLSVTAAPVDQGPRGGGEGTEKPPAPPGDQGRGGEGDTMKPKGRYLGILPPDPTWAGETCQRCQGTKLTATGDPCLDCEPLHVYIDRDRPLPADELERARRFLADRQTDRPVPSNVGRRLLARLGVDATVH